MLAARINDGVQRKVFSDGSKSTFYIHGVTNTFPAYYLQLNDKILFESYPTASGPGAVNLGLHEQSFYASGIINADESITVGEKGRNWGIIH